MGTIVVGYVPKPEGHAALRRAAEEARCATPELVVVNSHRGGREFDREDAIDSEERARGGPPRAPRGRASSTRSASWSAAWTRPTTWSTWPPRCRPSSS